MDNNSAEGVDDQGSGWLQVKKKHRSSAKFSPKSCAGGFSGKNDSTYQLKQPSSREKSRNSYGNRRSQISKEGTNPFNQVCGDFASCDFQSNATQNGVLGPVKLFVEQDGERSEISKLPKSLASNSTARVEDTQRSLQKDQPDAVQKIKWGDLEDDVLALHHENHSRADTLAGDAKDNTLVSTEHGNDFSSVPCVSSSSKPLETQLMMTPVDADSCPDQTFPFTLNEGIIIGENCKEVSNFFSQIAEVPTMNDHKVAQNEVSIFRNVESDHFKPTSNENLSSIPPSGEDSGKVVKIQLPAAVCEIDESSIFGLPCTILNSADSEKNSVSLMTGDRGPEISNETGIMVRVKLPVVSAVNKSNIPELACTSGNSGMVVISQDNKLFLPSNDDNKISREPGVIVKLQLPVVSEVNESQISEVSLVNRNLITVVKSLDDKSLASGSYGPEILGESSVKIPVEDPGCLPLNSHNLGETAHDEAQNTSSLVEGDTSESKERFRQRLWCFLFENLNRAIDELYLLCELECDAEQMKEAILVLEEASSDFKDLTTRVHGFDKMKWAHSHSIDGAPITLKSDHRRPHALSWEVRRMTTSPHRAEILSSSLEAFKKIQQERANKLALGHAQTLCLGSQNKPSGRPVGMANSRDSMLRLRKKNGGSDSTNGNVNGEMRNLELGRSSKVDFVKTGVDSTHNLLSSDVNTFRLPSRDTSVPSGGGKSKREADTEKLLRKKEKILSEFSKEKTLKSTDDVKKQTPSSEKDRERRNSAPWKFMDAWKEKRNWEDVLSSPFRVSSRISHSQAVSRKSAERARVLHDKLMSPEKKKKTAWDLKKEAEEKHARAMRIRSELENERVQKLQRTSEKLNRVNEWQAVRTLKLREGMYARHQRGESRHVAFIAKVVRRAGDESSKVNEVRFITSLNEENKKLILRQKLQDSELRRAEKLQVIKTKQKEDMAREEAVLERRRVIEAEKLQRLAETQRKKEEAQIRREEERKASSAAREARAIEQLRRREERVKAQQEEAELLAQKLAERLSESEQRRKYYLEQIRERASMDFRDQSSPLLRRFNKEGQGRITPTNNGDYLENSVAGSGASTRPARNVTLQHSLKRRIKKIRQRLMALKYEFTEPPFGSENAGIGYRTSVGTARVKVGRWLQELQRLRQARKEGFSNIGLITADMIKFLDGKDPELQASRQTGLLDFISSALPASHITKPEACQVTVHLLKLLKVILTAPANRSYFLAQNLLPPIIPMLSAALENYIKISASLNVPGIANITSSKTSVESFESISEVLDNFLWVVGVVVGHTSSDGRELQMRDGLVELLIAYQVIHRLRDLFALYDRPQVEGSPFPPSILLSIQLLVFLTQRPSSKSSINWETSPIQSMQGFDSQEKKLSEVAEFGYSSLSMDSEDYKLPLSVLNDTTTASAPDLLEGKSLDDLYRMNKGDEPVVDGEGNEKKPSCSSVALTNANTSMDGIRGESHELSGGLKDARQLVNVGVDQNNRLTTKQPAAFLLSAMSETGLVSLPSLLTAVLLQANNRLSSSEQGIYVLPSNFEEVATGVLKVLNNLALLDVTSIQRMLAMPDLRMEFFHLMSFLLSYCTNKWKVASDQVGLLLLESLLLLGYFALFHPENQAVLRWGKSPTILHKVCDLPFVFFSDPELMPVLAGTLVAACYGCVQNKGVVQQELSMDMLLSLLRSCRNMQALGFSSHAENFPTDGSSDSNQLNSEARKNPGDIISMRSNRFNGKSSRSIMGKGTAMGNSTRASKMRSLRDFKALKACEELALKHNALAPETSTMLHHRFPSSFIAQAEYFFSEGK